MTFFGQVSEEQIVHLLKEKIGISFTLFSFSEVKGKELLELLNTVVYNIDNSMPEKIGTEKMESVVMRISEFLRVLKYEFPCEAEEWDVRLANADSTLIHSALLFLLSNFEELKHRAYLAKYLEDVPIPDEIKVEPTVSELLTQQRELRDLFEQRNQEYEELGSNNVDELKSTIKDLESNKARLATKISTFKRKMTNVQNLEGLLKITAQIRQENEREMKLQEQLQRLSDEKKLLLHRQKVASDRIKNMHTNMEKRLQSLQQELETLKSNGKSTDEKSLIFCQNQVLAAKKRFDTKQKQLNELKQTNADLTKQLQQLQQEVTVEIPIGEQYSQYIRMLKNKNENYKVLHTELVTVRRELAIMMRTEEIVRRQSEKISNEVAKIERQKGVTGFRQARQQLEQYSAAKADLDDIKGKSLEEMSQIVQEIQRSIQARQVELKPFVVSLQKQRKLKADLESKYLYAKQKHQNAINEYETISLELEEEIKKLRNDISNYQTKYHTLMNLFNNIERENKRIEEEKNALETGKPISNDIKTYSDFFQKSLRNMAKETKSLNEQKKVIGIASEENQKQLEAFQSLRQLLTVIQQCQKADAIKKEEQLKLDDFERNIKGEIIDFRNQSDEFNI
ncbi:intraflagellar transport protein [Histomonas meleagridis]|uniref:intraflagellar transport protein 81-like n=1 Tax=Histomonas meleagridis TaxID=135588 RepID=UPI00355A2BC7|nr:intraflagellar transport protein [Histomonas meleagridis]KAH0804841.1 intraflagellar transport protein 81-like [Histomonas meleagridis]